MILSARDIHKVYNDTAIPVTVLSGVSLSLRESEAIGISGASGSGKSTLLHILGGLDFPTSGSIEIAGDPISKFSRKKLADFRNKKIGFVFQFYHLLPEFTALENVMLPALISGMGKERAKREALAMIDEMGLLPRAGHLPSTLSGGEQQRIAIARAAVMRPSIIFADEPTGNLDTKTGVVVWDFLMKLNKSDGISIVVVSHNEDLLSSLPKVLNLKDGVLLGSLESSSGGKQ